jgi:hypothetical protein
MGERMTGLRRWIVLIGLAVGSRAFAASYYVEAAPSGDKAAADAAAAAASTADHPARVVRRYNAGHGWEYLVMVEGFADQPSAEAAATRVAAAIGQTVTVFKTDGADAQVVADNSPAAPAAAAAPPAAPEPASAAPVAAPPPAAAAEPAAKGHKGDRAAALPPVDDVTARREQAAALLAAAVDAHGGADGGLPRVQAADNVLFRYRRLVPGGPTVLQTYAERGADRYLDVVIESGEGTASRSGVVGGKAWLSQAGAGAVTEDLAQTTEQLDRFSPEKVLSFPLGFARSAADRREFQSLEADGTTTVDGLACDVLRFPGDGAVPPMAMAIATTDHRVRRITFASDAGNVTHEFSDWREAAPGVVVPFHVRTWRDATLIDEIVIVDLDLRARLPDDWFRGTGT